MKLREVIAFVIAAVAIGYLCHLHLDSKWTWVYVDGGALIGGAFVTFLHMSAAWEQAKLVEQAFSSKLQNLLKEFEASANTPPPTQKPDAPVADHVASLDDK